MHDVSSSINISRLKMEEIYKELMQTFNNEDADLVGRLFATVCLIGYFGL